MSSSKRFGDRIPAERLRPLGRSVGLGDDQRAVVKLRPTLGESRDFAEDGLDDIAGGGVAVRPHNVEQALPTPCCPILQ
mgnify:CR=1 FL=1